MSYISAMRAGDDVLVWERTPEGRELKLFPAPYYCYIRSKEGTYTSIYGDKLERLDFSSSDELYQFRMQSANTTLFESDIPPELKVLSERYYNVPAPKLHVSFLDIEVDYSKEIGFSSVDNPYAPINSVAIYHNWSNRMVVYAVPPKEYDGPRDEETIIKRLNDITPLPSDVSIEIHLVRNERELLMALLEEIKDSDVVSGWNSDFFDVPYIGKRLELMGSKYFYQLSFPGANKPKWRTVEVMKKEVTTLDLSGRSSVDYMVLFKKYEMAERPSYKLESIANEILPHLPKLEYEGSLADLYRKDFMWFIRYNFRDTEILKGFEERLGYVELANQMYHLSTGLFQHVTGTLKLAELATINYCHHELGGLVVNDVDVPEDDGQIQGAFVLLPQINLHEWVGSIDINSLYPSAIRAINISPETIRGQFLQKVQACEEIAKNSDAELTLALDGASQEITLPASKWRSKLQKLKWSVSGYGTVFDQNVKGIIPTILADWYAMRKKYQKEKAIAKDNAKAILKKYGSVENMPEAEARLCDEFEQKETYYDKLQYVYKIKLNSFYGALTNKYFRFYDLRMGESTTGTGRMILLHQCAKAVEVLDGVYTLPDRKIVDEDGNIHYGYSDKWSVVYGDTDSSYFRTKGVDLKTAVEIADGVGEIVNDSFPAFMRDTFLCNDEFDGVIKTGREIVSDRGIFVDKKRYILHVVDKEGDAKDELKVMGLDTKKTTLPVEVAKRLNAFVGRYLKGETWERIEVDIVEYKEELTNTKDIMSIGLPKGIKGVEDYTMRYQADSTTRLPGHVAAGIFYNICLKQFNDKLSMPIMSGMKIKVFYLTQPVGRFKSIAIPVDAEEVPEWFLTNFSVDKDAHIERLVDNPLGNIIKAIGKQVPSKQSLLVNELLEF